MVCGVIIITPLLPIIGSKFNNMQEKAKLEKTLASSGKQTPDEDSDEASVQDPIKTVTFAEQQETFEIPEYSRRSTLEIPEYVARPRSVTVH